MEKTPAPTSRLKKQVLLLGGVIVAGSAYFLIDHLRIVTRFTKTIATVVKVTETYRHKGNSARTYIPTVRFTTHSGNTLTLSTGYASSVYNFDPGDKIALYYNHKVPGEFYIPVFATTWGLPLFGLFCGTLILWSARKL